MGMRYYTSTEVPIGEVIEHKNKSYMCMDSSTIKDDKKDCDKCDMPECLSFKCTPRERKDKKFIYFKEIK